MTGITWRAFVGRLSPDGTPEWAHLDVPGCTWEQARDLLAEELRGFNADDCTDCRTAGAEALSALLAAEPKTAFEGEVDGEDYAIIAEPAAG
jgi:hypothetical protein